MTCVAEYRLVYRQWWRECLSKNCMSLIFPKTTTNIYRNLHSKAENEVQTQIYVCTQGSTRYIIRSIVIKIQNRLAARCLLCAFYCHMYPHIFPLGLPAGNVKQGYFHSNLLFVNEEFVCFRLFLKLRPPLCFPCRGRTHVYSQTKAKRNEKIERTERINLQYFIVMI